MYRWYLIKKNKCLFYLVLKVSSVSFMRALVVDVLLSNIAVIINEILACADIQVSEYIVSQLCR